MKLIVFSHFSKLVQYLEGLYKDTVYKGCL